jgi:hypothetical protein
MRRVCRRGGPVHVEVSRLLVARGRCRCRVPCTCVDIGLRRHPAMYLAATGGP